MSRQTVERETPSVRPASSTVTIATAIPRSYHTRLTVSIVSCAIVGCSCPRCHVVFTTATASISTRNSGRNNLGT
jgi:hypothetical protein